MRVAENGKELARFEYHNNGQIAKAIRENGVETFEWDGLALIERSGTKYINEPHAGGGNPVLVISDKSTEAIFTDMLGTSIGKVEENGYSAIDKTSFGADSSDNSSFFTGKPYIEKLGTIFVHLASEFLTDAVAIFENHAGCEKGYFLKKDATPIPLPKYTDRVAYKNGDKSKIYYIPDLVLWNKARNEIINIEGKTYENREKGIVEIDNYDSIEKDFIIPEYAPSTIKRTVVLYGEKNDNEPLHRRIGLLLTDKGRILLGPKPPSIFEDIIKRASVKDCGEEKI